MLDCIDKNGRESCRAAKIGLFENLTKFIEEYSGFSNLVLENFSRLFLYYFLICSLVFVAFCLHHLVKVAKKSTLILELASQFAGIYRRRRRRARRRTF